MAEGYGRKSYDIDPRLCQRGLSAIGAIVLSGNRPLTQIATPIDGGYKLRKPLSNETPNAAKRIIEFVTSCLDAEPRTADAVLIQTPIGKQGLITLTYPEGLFGGTDLPAKRMVIFGSTTVTDYTHVHQGARGFAPLDTASFLPDNAALGDFVGGLENAKLL